MLLYFLSSMGVRANLFKLHFSSSQFSSLFTKRVTLPLFHSLNQLTKHHERKLKSLLSFYFSILFLFSILLHFHPLTKQTLSLLTLLWCSNKISLTISLSLSLSLSQYINFAVVISRSLTKIIRVVFVKS